MPAATAEKLDTDPRAALKAAITNAQKALTAVSAAEDAVKRGEDLVADFEAEHAKVTNILEAAAAEDSAAAADAIVRQESLGAANARHKVERQLDEITECKALAASALPELKRQLQDKKLAAAVARNRVCVERNTLLAPIATATLARINAARAQMLKDRALLAALISDNGAPEFPRQPAAFFESRNAEAARKKPFSTLWAEAAADAADFAVVPHGCSIAETEAVTKAHAAWIRQLAGLLEDANAELPGEK